MGAWRRTGVMDQFEQKLIQGMLSNGYSEEFACNLFRQIEGFGSYGFPESHAASFALLVYVSAWIKCHYPAVFLAALLNSQPMGFYGPSQLVSDVTSTVFEVTMVDINKSDCDCTLSAATKMAIWPCDWACQRSKKGLWHRGRDGGNRARRRTVHLLWRVRRTHPRHDGRTVTGCGRCVPLA